MTTRTSVWLVMPLLLLALPTSVHAQDEEDLADRYFKEGQSAFEMADYNTACPKIEASVRLKKRANRMGMLAACFQMQGKLASALRTFRETQVVAQEAGEQNIATAAAGHVAELEAKVAHLVIHVQASDRPKLVVSLDGGAVPPGDLERPLEIDGGSHKIIARAADGREWTKVVETKDGTTEAVNLFAGMPPLSQRGESPMTLRKKLSLGTVGAGVVVMGVGAFFGLRASNAWDDAQSAGCSDSGQCPTPIGVDKVNDAGADADMSTVLFITGGAIVAAGVVLWVTAPDGATPEQHVSARVRPMPMVGGGGLMLEGTF